MAKHKCGTCWNEYDCGKVCEHKGFYLMCSACKKGMLESSPHSA
ncbi:MAG TPA: hypothetical protein VI893_08545 [Thermoplasmata archaeon]|nr:hypothetical protein [Thermoplasmata archaeon]